MNNAGTVRFAREFLLQMRRFCCTTSAEDTKTLVNILTVKLKNMQASFFFDSLVSVLRNHPEFPRIGTNFSFWYVHPLEFLALFSIFTTGDISTKNPFTMKLMHTVLEAADGSCRDFLISEYRMSFL